MTEKKILDCSGKEYEDILRSSRWHSEFKTATLQTFFQEKDVSHITQHTLNVATAWSVMIRYSLEQYLLEKGCVILKYVGLNHDSDEAASFSDIEYSTNKFKSCLSEGFVFFTYQQANYTLEIQPRHNNTVDFICTTKVNSTVTCRDFLKELQDYAEAHNFLRGQKIDASCTFIKFDRPFTWDDIILPEGLKEDIRRNLRNLLESREIYRKNNLTIKRGLVFSGVPGTGKSLLGKVLCHVSDWTFLWVTPKYVTRPSDVASVIEMARALSPTILFLEDVDLFGADRHSGGDGALLGELMNQLDGIQENKDVITIATTNRQEVIEKALVDRPGRFDKVIEFKVPDEAARIDMLKYFLKPFDLAETINTSTLAKLTNGLAGAHIRELVNLAVLYAIDEKSYTAEEKIILKPRHFGQALKQAKKKNFEAVGFLQKDSSLSEFFDEMTD